jgi:hypothetical protein
VSTRRRHLAAVGACAVLLVGPACGSSDEPEEGEPLPADAVAALVKRLDEVQRRYDVGTNQNKPGACEDIENDSYKAIDATVRDLPQDVDPDVREALEASLARLKDLTSEGCAGVEEEPEVTETTPPVQPVTPPVVPEQPPPEQTETQPPPEEEKPKDEEDNGKNNGNGKGKGKGDGNDNQPGGTDAPGGAGGQPAPPAGEG